MLWNHFCEALCSNWKPIYLSGTSPSSLQRSISDNGVISVQIVPQKFSTAL